LNFSLQGALQNTAKEEKSMITTRRKFLRFGYITSLGLAIPSRFRLAHAQDRPPVTDIGIDEFLLEWAELADWRTITGAYPAPAMHNSVMHAMSRKYVTDYFDLHGEVPTGVHRVRYSCGRDPSNDVFSSVCGESRLYDEIFTFLGGNGISIKVVSR
jgi:hypothetical protein